MITRTKLSLDNDILRTILFPAFEYAPDLEEFYGFVEEAIRTIFEMVGIDASEVDGGCM